MSMGTSSLNFRWHLSPKCPSNAFGAISPGRVFWMSLLFWNISWFQAGLWQTEAQYYKLFKSIFDVTILFKSFYDKVLMQSERLKYLTEAGCFKILKLIQGYTEFQVRAPNLDNTSQFSRLRPFFEISLLPFWLLLEEKCHLKLVVCCCSNVFRSSASQHQ